jgi:exosortase
LDTESGQKLSFSAKKSGTFWTRYAPRPALELQTMFALAILEGLTRPKLMGNLAQAASLSERTVSPPSSWKKFLDWRTAVLLILMGWLYAAILGRLANQWWTDPNFSHGFFVPAFSLFLVWQGRSQLESIRRTPSAWGLPVILFSLCLLLLGVFGAELFLSRVSLVMLIGGMIIFFLGWKMLQAVLFPLLFLFLMVPIPAIVFSQITFPLQILASKLAAWSLPLCGVPVLREGNVITLPAMPLEVAEACSGIRSLLSLTTLAIMYGYLMEKKLAIRVLLAAMSVPIAVAANGFRIVGTGLLVQYWDPDKAEGFFHAFSGWLVFVASLLMLFAVHQAMRLMVRGDRLTA